MINYKHLHYFWVIAKAGGIARASERLHLTSQTISGQLSVLEQTLGEPLFNRVGRKLELTDTGKVTLEYAEEIFSLGGELEEMLRNKPKNRPMVFKVGVTDVAPKSIAYRLIAPSLQSTDPVRIVCREGSLETLMAELAIHKVDLVIADGPTPASVKVRGYNHLLGECGISFFATPALAATMNSSFPQNLNNAPLLLPGEMTAVQSKIIEWFETLNIHPHIVGEFDDSALMKAFGQAGTGIFIAPTAIATEVEKQYNVISIGQTKEVLEQFYAISVDRKMSHPSIAAITETASEWLSLEGAPTKETAKRKKS